MCRISVHASRLAAQGLPPGRGAGPAEPPPSYHVALAVRDSRPYPQAGSGEGLLSSAWVGTVTESCEAPQRLVGDGREPRRSNIS